MITYTSCPICKQKKIKPYLTVKDFSVSKDDFDLVICEGCSFVCTQNIPDENSIAPYYKFDDYISHTDTQVGLVNKLYHYIRKKTLLKKLSWLKKYTKLEKGNILDIGCGTGAFLETMQKNNWTIEGIEPDETARNKAKELYQLMPSNPSALFEYAPTKFDAITMWHVLEHVHELDAYVLQLKKLLANKGRIFIAVPNYTSYDAVHYKNYWAAYDVPRHLYHFSPKAMQVLASNYGFTIEAMQPMWYDSFYVSMLSEKYKKGNIIFAIINGFISNIKAFFNKDKCSSITYILQHKN
jgi:2-polyprenyl-3-methyl-5-hydroxy-6-metoxy-1,4-benzoquinol methylase